MSQPLRTFADHLREQGKVTTDMFDCPECDGPPQPAFAIVEASPGRWVCSTCHITEQQQAALAAEDAAKAALPPWETDDAQEVRRTRTRLQDQWRWAIMPDSPLTAEARARVMLFLKLLNTLTIDYTSPEEVVWPVEPTLTGEDYDPDA